MTFITNVTLVDVEKQKLVSKATIGFTGELITSIGTKNSAIPAGSIIIDGSGKYVMPGLTDAHIHFSQTGGYIPRLMR